ncbi:MAG: AAA family ATPase [Muribaculaceae bacterium]|nr:AAA family ATPase [Muribaculaceae bacterium]
MDTHQFAERIYLNLPYEPNSQQIELIAALARFCSDSTPSDSVFLLTGYAGTGKTSVTGALVRALREYRVPVVLLAPTGRAAKVFGAFARHPAFTIHRRIYRAPSSATGYSFGTVGENTLSDAVFIVDEASMIGAASSETGTNLLEDLIHYVYSGINCRMILLGDTAQLPPVGTTVSPAMDVPTLRSYGLRVSKAVMTAVVRQGSRSGILYNATWLRKAMLRNPLPPPELHLAPFSDICAISGEDMAEQLESAYGEPEGVESTIVITRSNKRATGYNLAIRANILGREEELCRGERLLVAKNNYLWSAKIKGLDFIANGDVAVITSIYGTETKYGLRFADVRINLPDRDIDVECKIMLDTLTSDTPALDPELGAEFYESIMNDPDLFTSLTPMGARMRILRSDPYFNALQVKYAYAVTCHKAQGGQWPTVFVDMGYIAPEARGLDFYRWLYTATTRATTSLILVNPDPDIFAD